MKRGAAGSHVNGIPCHADPERDTDTGLTDGQHALQRGAEGPAPKGRMARSTKAGSADDGPREFGGCLSRARRAGCAVSGLTNSTRMRALRDARWPEAASARRRVGRGILTEASEKRGHRNSVDI